MSWFRRTPHVKDKSTHFKIYRNSSIVEQPPKDNEKKNISKIEIENERSAKHYVKKD